MARTTIARWQSRKGKTWIELYRDDYGHGYAGDDCGGNLGSGFSDDSAAAEMERRIVSYLTPDAHKNPLKRVG